MAMTCGELGEVLRAVYDGRARFDDVVRQHKAQFKALAAQIMRRWRLPPWVSLEDVEQDLYVSAWQSVWDFEPGRGPSIETYVVWNAYDKAKKRAHKARKAKRSGSKADSNPSRYERGYGAVWGDDAPRRSEEESAVPAEQERAVRELEVEDEVHSCAKNLREWHAVRAARELGELEGFLAREEEVLAKVAHAIFEDNDARRECEYEGRVQAECGTVLAAAAVAERAVVELQRDERAA